MNYQPENFQRDLPEDGSDFSDRLTVLLADRALGELAAEDVGELDALLKLPQSDDCEAFDRITAALELGLLVEPLEPLPDHLRQKVLAAAMREIAPANQPRVDSIPAQIPAATSRKSPPRSSGWFMRFAPTLAAAAILLIAFSLSFRPKVSPIAARQSLLDSAKDVVLLSWTATEDPAAQGASGDVAWSNSRQTGYMRFSGLPKNDPLHEQYQLWIFDPSQDARYPVDGGVFNIDQSTGQAIIPISARLHLTGPTLFAITIEKPGGVVVSDRKRLPLLAKVPPVSATQSK